MGKLAEYLNRHIVGNVFDNPTICQKYSTDRSVLEILPRLVAFPENSNDIRHLLRFVHQLSLRGFQLPVTPRGTGLDPTGAAIGSGLILSLERMNKIEEIDPRGRLVRVQPGLTLGELNSALALQGLWLPIGANPKTTIGGLIANCPADDYLPRHGGIYHAVERLEIVLASGDLIQLAPYNQRQISSKIAATNPNPAESALYKALDLLLEDQADTILDRATQPFDAAGYSNVTRVHEGHSTNLLPLIFASQGTLGVIADIILHVEPLPPAPRRLLVSFHDQRAAERFLSQTVELDPYLLNLYDLRILETAASLGKKSDLFTRKFGGGYLALIGFDHSSRKSEKCLDLCQETLPSNTLRVLGTPENAADFREIDSILLAYLNSALSSEFASVLDDVSIPAASLSDFISGLTLLEQTFDQPLPLFGSYLTSRYTVRPALDLSALADRRQLPEFIRLYTDLVSSCGGSTTGNRPEGRLGAIASTHSFGIGERQVYSALKTAFDPQNILNPGVKLDPDPEILRHLRTYPLGGIITP